MTGSEHLLNCSSCGCYWSTLVRMNVWLRLTGLTGSCGEGGLAQVLQSNTSATGTAKEVQAGSLWKVSEYTEHHSLAADQSGIRTRDMKEEALHHLWVCHLPGEHMTPGCVMGRRLEEELNVFPCIPPSMWVLLWSTYLSNDGDHIHPFKETAALMG